MKLKIIMNVLPYDFYINQMGILYSALFILLLSAHIPPGSYILYIKLSLLFLFIAFLVSMLSVVTFLRRHLSHCTRFLII